MSTVSLATPQSTNEPAELTLSDYISLARNMLWVVNESLANVAMAAPRLQAADQMKQAILGSLIQRLDELRPTLTGLPVTVGLPPDCNHAVVKLYELLLAQRDNDSFGGASAVSRG